MQPCIILLQFLLPLGFFNPQAAIFFTQIFGLLCHAELSADFSHRLDLSSHDFCCPQSVDDVFGCEALLGTGLILHVNSA